MTKAERAWLSKVSGFGCFVCKKMGYDDSPAEIHHIGNQATGLRASNFEVIPLCANHHRNGGYGVAIHAGKQEWERLHGSEKDILKEINACLTE